MNKFTHRSDQKELLDENDIPVYDLYRNLKELDFINTYLGGHSVTVAGLSEMTQSRDKTYRILDIGSGGGDTLRYVAKWGRKNGYAFELTGVDLKQDCINFAIEKSKGFPEISFICSDYRNLDQLNQSFDIMISSLFCHHLTDEEFTALLEWMNARAETGFILNDLHRHRFAYYSISWLTALFSKSYLVKHDARLSVLRGFSRNEIEHFILQSGIRHTSLTWQWAFRWLLTVKTHT